MAFDLRGRLALIFFASTALAIVLSSVVWLLGLRAVSERAEAIGVEAVQLSTAESLAASARNSVRTLAHRLVNPVYFLDLSEVGKAIGPILEEDEISQVVVFDQDGTILHDGTEEMATFGDPLVGLTEGWIDGEIELDFRDRDDMLYAVAPLVLGSEVIGGVRLTYDLSARTANMAAAADAIVAGNRKEIAQRLEQVMLLLAGLIVVGLLAALKLAGNVLRPVRELLDHAQQIEAGRYEVAVKSERTDELGDLLRAFQRMGTAVHRNTLEIRHLAYHDSLSGLPNRRMFREALDEEIAALDKQREERLALLFLDLDDFKRVNDSLGHDIGDRVLVDFTERLRLCLEDLLNDNPEDPPRSMLARLGGDEFTVMLVSADASAQADDLARRLIGRVAEPMTIDDRSFHLGTSVGITVYPDDATTGHRLLKNADIAMYRAKMRGKNHCQRFHRGLTSNTHQRLDLETRLRRALNEDQLHVNYQPIVSLESQAIWGCEALARIDTGGRRDFPPSVFIPIAEEIGLIDEIGRRVLETACVDASSWHGPAPPRVTVNLSARQLRDEDLPAQIERALEHSGLAPRRLILEITESSLLGTNREIVTLLSQLRALGVQVWLDDFGTGFSGLSHLRRLPVDGVKIDRSFVCDIHFDPDDLNLASAIIGMASSLEMEVIAEGVESEEQLDLLRSRKCQLAQGFLFGRPQSAMGISALLEPGHHRKTEPRASA